MVAENEVSNRFGIRIILKDPESFLLVKETLTRLGVASNRTKTLYQSAHILHKQGEYYICHFKEMFKLDGKPSDISEEDFGRRNLITKLLCDWGLVILPTSETIGEMLPMSGLKIISHKDKENWELISKYTVGNKSRDVNGNR